MNYKGVDRKSVFQSSLFCRYSIGNKQKWEQKELVRQKMWQKQVPQFPSLIVDLAPVVFPRPAFPFEVYESTLS